MEGPEGGEGGAGEGCYGVIFIAEGLAEVGEELVGFLFEGVGGGGEVVGWVCRAGGGLGLVGAGSYNNNADLAAGAVSATSSLQVSLEAFDFAVSLSDIVGALASYL